MEEKENEFKFNHFCSPVELMDVVRCHHLRESLCVSLSFPFS